MGSNPDTKLWGEEVFSKLSWFRADVVESARVMVVGCGALGNEVLKNLVLFGIKSIVIVDFDCVEESNLCRSILFRDGDVAQHRSKVDVVKERLRDINPEVNIDTIKGDISYDVGLGLMRKMDVVISCLDNRYARYCLCRLAFRVDVPWVDGGIDGLDGTARVFRYGENCYACNLGERGIREMSQRMSCANIVRYNQTHDRVATTPVIASIIGGIEVQEAMKLIHKEELSEGKFTSLCGKMYYWEGEHLSSKMVEFRRYEDDCPLHDRWDGVIETKLSSNVTVAEFIAEVERLLSVSNVKIILSNRSFVEYIELSEYAESGGDGATRVEVMLPSFRVAEFVASDEHLSRLPSGAIYQKEHKVIGADFCFSELTLFDIGVPRCDIVKIESSEGVKYIELGGDASIFMTYKKE